MLVCTLATGGTFIGLLLLELPGQRDLQVQLRNEQNARQIAERANQAFHEADLARQAAEEARRAADVAKKIAVEDP